jgi:cysteine protease ATG4
MAKDDSGPTKPKGTYAETLYTYYYNGLASVTAAVTGDQKLLDGVDTWVMGKKYCGLGTTQWASDEVRLVSYFTYRNRLTVPLSNGATHDAGWGCMIRTGQMMLAEALKRLFLTPQGLARLIPPGEPAARGGRSRAGAVSSTTSPRQQHPDPCGTALADFAAEPIDILQSWFCDSPSAPFGLHSMTDAGATFGVPVGTWFSPSVLCKVFERLCNRGRVDAVSNNLTVVNASDQAVFRDVLLDEVCVRDKGVLLLVPVMLGMTAVSKQYIPVIHRILEMKTSIGIVGGKPKQSLYFVGHQQDQLFYLDPHVVQPAFLSKQTIGEPGGPRGTCATSSLDPCMVLCFLFNDASDVISWEQEMKEVNEMPEFPIVMIQFRTPAQIAAAAQQQRSGLCVEDAAARARAEQAMMVEDCRFDDDDDLL